MKKLMVILALSFLYSSATFAQSENDEPTTIYSKESSGAIYIILAVPDHLIQISKKEISKLFQGADFASLRISTIIIDDLAIGQTPLLVIRKFEGQNLANMFIEKMNTSSILKEHNLWPISQANYRIFLKRQDLDEYHFFLMQQE